jgi:sugar lactone lactonase YvrE
MLKNKNLILIVLLMGLTSLWSFGTPAEQAQKTDPELYQQIMEEFEIEVNPSAKKQFYATTDRDVEDWYAEVYPYSITRLGENEQYIFLGSTGGILKINKNNLSYEVISNTDLGSNANNVSALKIAPNGDIWLGFTSYEANSSTGGVSILHTDGEITTYTMENSEIRSNIVSDFLFTADGSTWISYSSGNPTMGGLTIVDAAGNWQHLTTNNSDLPCNSIVSMYLDSQGRKWLSLNGDYTAEVNTNLGGGLLMIDTAGEWHHFDDEIIDYEAPEGITKEWSVMNVVEDSTGKIWFGLTGLVAVQTETGLFSYDGESFTAHTIPEISLGIKSYWKVAIDSQDRIWINMVWNMIACYDQSDWTIYETNQLIQSINADSSGRVWVGLYGEALLKIEDMELEEFVYSNPDNPLMYNFFNTMATDSAGNMYFGQGWYFPDWAAENALLIKSGDLWETYSTETLGTCAVNDIRVNSEEMILATGVDAQDYVPGLNIWGGVAIRRNDSWTIHNSVTTNFPFIWARRAVRDYHGNLWAGNHLDGLAHFDYTWNFVDHPAAEGVLDIIAETSEPLLWFATTQGLKKIEIDEQGISSVEQYHPGNSDLPDPFVTDLEKDFYDDIWIATQAGLAKFNGVEIVDYSDLTGELYIVDITTDEYNRVWMATDSGLYLLDEQEELHHFDSSNSPLAENMIQTLGSDKNGNLWVNPVGNGLYTYTYSQVGAEETEITLSSKPALKIYPNPFNPTTNIKFDLAVESDVTINIYNARGQKVKSWDKQSYSAGSHSLAWDASDDAGKALASGIYYCQVKSTQQSTTKKMLLMK